MSQHDIKYLASDHLWSFIGLPGTVRKPKGKPIQVTLNFFINMANRFIQNSAKQKYAKVLDKILVPVPAVPYDKPVKLLYIYYAASSHRRDLDNMTAVLIKFTNDALVNKGFLIDDSTEYIKNIHVVYGGKDPNKFNHCDLHIFKDNTNGN